MFTIGCRSPSEKLISVRKVCMFRPPRPRGFSFSVQVRRMSSDKSTVLIHLHTYDLRLHDSPSLHIAHQPASSITHFLPVYIFDQHQIDISELPNASSSSCPDASTQTSKQDANPNHFGPMKTRASPMSRVGHFHRSSPHRLQFLLQSTYGLRDAYRRSGGDMLIGYGKPEILVPELVRALSERGSVAEVRAQEEVSLEEMAMYDRLQAALAGVELKLNQSKTLVPPQHLPFDPQKDTPDVYTSFRKKAEGLGLNLGGGMLVKPMKTAEWDQFGKGVRVSIGKDKASLKPFPNIGEMRIAQGRGGWVKNGDDFNTIDGMYAKLVAPLLESPPIGGWSAAVKEKTPPPTHSQSAIPFPGGEEAALARLDDYVGHPIANGWEGGNKAKHYKATRNGLRGEGFSTKFAAFFSLGCLSAREAGWRVGELLEQVGRDKATRDNVYCEFNQSGAVFGTYFHQGSSSSSSGGISSSSRPSNMQNEKYHPFSISWVFRLKLSCSLPKTGPTLPTGIIRTGRTPMTLLGDGVRVEQGCRS